MFEHGSEGMYHSSDTEIQQTVAVKEEQSAAPSRHCSFLCKLFIFKSLNRVAGRVASSSNPAAPGQPGRQPGLAAGAPRSSLTESPRTFPPRATLTGDL